MKNLVLTLVSVFFFSNLQAQEKRASPLVKASAEVNGTQINIEYGQPSKKGRAIFGDLVPYGKVWRTGANEATVIEFSEDVTINGQVVKAGKYALFTIPGEEEWTIILNKVWNQWGAYNYDASKDVISFKVAVETKSEVTEAFTITISKKGLVELYWDKTGVEFKIEA
jgi:hypothetical protein